jgi:glyoxylate/hydroxypyruvate reductase
MSLCIYFAAPAVWDEYCELLPALLREAGIAAEVVTEVRDPALVDYIIYAPSAPLQDFSPFVKCKAVLSLWAGVERIVGNATLTQPLCRMVDSGLTEGMVEWVVGHALRHHLGMDRHIVNPGRVWDPTCPPLGLWAPPVPRRWRRCGFRCWAGAGRRKWSRGWNACMARMVWRRRCAAPISW